MERQNVGMIESAMNTENSFPAFDPARPAAATNPIREAGRFACATGGGPERGADPFKTGSFNAGSFADGSLEVGAFNAGSFEAGSSDPARAPFTSFDRSDFSGCDAGGRALQEVLPGLFPAERPPPTSG